jgi:hypothetical protein
MCSKHLNNPGCFLSETRKRITFGHLGTEGTIVLKSFSREEYEFEWSELIFLFESPFIFKLYKYIQQMV